MEEKKRISSSKKKILVVFAVFITAIATMAWLYYFVLLRSPYYSAYMIFDSFRTHNVNQFNKYCDLEAVYSDAYDQIRAETLDSDTPVGRLAVGLKDYTVKKLSAQLRKQIEEGKHKKHDDSNKRHKTHRKIVTGHSKIGQKKITFDISAFDVLELGKIPDEPEYKFFERHINFKYLRFRTAHVIDKEDGAVIVAVVFHDLQLDEDLTVNVRMIPVEGGKYWRAVSVTNALETVLLRDILAMQKLDEFNADVNLEMSKYVAANDASVQLIRSKNYFGWDKFRYRVSYSVLDNSKEINQIEGVLIVRNSKGRIAQRELHYIEDVASQYEKANYRLGDPIIHEWEKYDNIGYIFSRDNGILQKDGDNCTFEFLITGLYFTDGTFLNAEDLLPAPELRKHSN